MDNVKRYTSWVPSDEEGRPMMVPEDDGDYVRFEDYEALCTQLDLFRRFQSLAMPILMSESNKRDRAMTSKLNEVVDVILEINAVNAAK